jgi:hypothetical protein
MLDPPSATVNDVGSIHAVIVVGVVFLYIRREVILALYWPGNEATYLFMNPKGDIPFAELRFRFDSALSRYDGEESEE